MRRLRDLTGVRDQPPCPTHAQLIIGAGFRRVASKRAAEDNSTPAIHFPLSAREPLPMCFRQLDCRSRTSPRFYLLCLRVPLTPFQGELVGLPKQLGQVTWRFKCLVLDGCVLTRNQQDTASLTQFAVSSSESFRQCCHVDQRRRYLQRLSVTSPSLMDHIILGLSCADVC